MAENTKIIISAVDKTKKGFGSVTSGLKKVTGAVFSMRTALVGVAGVAGFGLLIKSSLSATDSLAKTASKIGTTTEALSGLRYAADITGVATTTMDMALQRFTRRTAEAAKGTGEAKGALQTLGISARELVNMPLDQRMLVLADAFSKQTNESEKLALAFKLFDSEGAALVNTLGLGREGLTELLGEARALGVVMSSDAAQGVEDANDALTKLKSLFKGVTDQTVARLAPAIETLATFFKDKLLASIDKAKGGVEEFAQSIAIDLIDGFTLAIKASAKLGNAVIGTYNAMINAKAKWDSLMGNSANFDALQKDLDIVNEMLTTRNPLSRIRFFGEGGVVEWWDSDELNEKKKQLEQAMNDLVSVGQGSNLIPDIDVSTLLEGLAAGREAMLNYDSSLNTVKHSANNAGESIDNLRQAFVDWKANLSDVDIALQDVAKKGMNKFTDAFTDAITGAKNFGDAMRDMAKSVVDSLIKMLVQYYITKPLFDAITGSFGGGGNANPSGNASGTNLGGSRSFNGGGFTGMGSRSGGVDGKGGFPAILHPNETVIDHTKGQSSGVVVQQTINVTTGVQQTVRAEIVQLMPQIAQAAKGAVADARLRGGNFSKAMGGA